MRNNDLENNTRTISVRVDMSMYMLIKEKAIMQNTSMSAWASNALLLELTEQNRTDMKIDYIDQRIARVEKQTYRVLKKALDLLGEKAKTNIRPLKGEKRCDNCRFRQLNFPVFDKRG